MSGMYNEGDDDLQGEPIPQDMVVRTVLRDVVELRARKTFVQRNLAQYNLYVYRHDKALEPTVEGCNLNELLMTKKRFVPVADGGRKILQSEMTGMGQYSANNAQFPKVFTSLNQYLVMIPQGMTVKQFLDLEPEERKYIIRRHLEFVGIVGTRLDADGDDKAMGRIMISARTKGVARLTNVHPTKAIEQGKYVMWDVLDIDENRCPISGTPHHKVLAVPVTETPENIISPEVVKRKLGKEFKMLVNLPRRAGAAGGEVIDIPRTSLMAKVLSNLNLSDKAPTYDNVCADIIRMLFAFDAIRVSTDFNAFAARVETTGGANLVQPATMINDFKVMHRLFDPVGAGYIELGNKGDHPEAKSFLVNVVGRMITTFLRAALDASERRVGRAQTSARPGARFDAYVF